MNANILAALRQRTLVLRFLSLQPPQSTVESLKTHFRIADCVEGCGSIIHYSQDCCPVTKKRLPGLTVLVEDLKREIKGRGLEAGPETSSETSSETGPETGSETGPETGSETGSETGLNTTENVLDLDKSQLSELEQRLLSEFKNDEELRLVSAARGAKNIV